MDTTHGTDYCQQFNVHLVQFILMDQIVSSSLSGW